MRILAISLDLDDTLWPVMPVLELAEARLHDWLASNHPVVAAAFPPPTMRALRDRINAEHPQLAHDFTAQRRLSLRRAFTECGLHDAECVESAFEVFYAARNEVEPYVDVAPALARLAACLPLVSLTNGNADLQRIGLAAHFRACICARDAGVGKPDPAIFHAACTALDVPRECVLHVGDDPLLDVVGAREAGLRTAWINRDGRAWNPVHGRYDLDVRDLGALADWCEAHLAQNAQPAPPPVATHACTA